MRSTGSSTASPHVCSPWSLRAHSLALIFCALCAALLAATTADAHFVLQYPKPYNYKECKWPECRGPCPLTTGRYLSRNSVRRPAAVWKRGQRVVVKYHRNNHEGGFYRRSLVPVKHMFNAKIHRKTAFQYGCWEDGRTKCKGSGRNMCGTDDERYIYQNAMVVPTNIPDGKYVFAQVWYGGLKYTRKRPLFPDYHSCSFVEVRGGRKTNRWTPTFQPGKSHRKVARGKCATAAVKAGQCGGLPCYKNPVMEKIPDEFKDRNPPPIFSSIYRRS